MRPYLLIALAVASSLCDRVEALDLTPHDVPNSSGGPAVKRHFFQDGDKRMGFKVDNKMTVSGASNLATFLFDDLKAANMSISTSSKSPETPFDGEKNLESYRVAARALVPAGATEVQIEEKPNPIAINDWTSYQFVFNYNLFGVSYRRSVTFLNYNQKEQFVIDVRAPMPDYDKAYSRGYRVLNSLSELRDLTSTGPT